MLKMMLVAALATLMLITSVGFTSAQTPPDRPFDPASYDTNGNFVIDKLEVLAGIRDYFDDKITRNNILRLIVYYFDQTIVNPIASGCDAYNTEYTIYPWLRADYDDFAVCYTPEYSSDLDQIASYAEDAFTHLKAKYGINTYQNRSREDVRLHIMLLPEENADADIGTTRFKCCYDEQGELDWSGGVIAQIPYLTPSHSTWVGYDCLGRLGIRKADFHAGRHHARGNSLHPVCHP